MNLNELNNDKISIVVAGENVEINAVDSVKDTLKRIRKKKALILSLSWLTVKKQPQLAICRRRSLSIR